MPGRGTSSTQSDKSCRFKEQGNMNPATIVEKLADRLASLAANITEHQDAEKVAVDTQLDTQLDTQHTLNFLKFFAV